MAGGEGATARKENGRKMNAGRYAYFRGEMVPIERAQVSIMTHALNYGTGCFEGIRGYWNEERRQLYVFRMPEHYERMRKSARILMMDLPMSVEELCALTVDLLRRNGHTEDTYIRPLLYISEPIIGVRLHGLAYDFALFSAPFGAYVETEGAIRVRTSSWRRVDDNSAPARAKITGSYVNAALSKSEAVLDGYDEAVVLTDDGHVSEGSAENIFIVTSGRLVTPPVSDNILAGITRATLIQLARERFGIETEERKVDRTELYSADEAFLCGTGAQLLPIGEVDRRKVGTGGVGEITEALKSAYERIVHGEDPEYAHWLTPVYTGAERAPSSRDEVGTPA